MGHVFDPPLPKIDWYLMHLLKFDASLKIRHLVDACLAKLVMQFFKLDMYLMPLSPNLTDIKCTFRIGQVFDAC